MNSWLTKSGARGNQINRHRPNPCEVVIVYENTQAQCQLMQACDLLVKKLWTEREFKFQWWKFAHFTDPLIAKVAATTASSADLIIFSAEAKDNFSDSMTGWIESWLPQRTKCGTLTTLFTQNFPPAAFSTLKHQYLMKLARSAGMDYHSQMLPSQAEAIEASLEIILKRPDALAHIVKEILDHDPCLRRWGIND